VDLLDRMVEQGEDWLILTMRRLDHFEKTGMSPKDYSTWCEHALSGAYDWIDHDRLSSGSSAGAAPAAGSGRQGAAPASAGRQGAAPASPSVPDWLNRGNSGGGRGAADVPTAPVPAQQRYSDSGYYNNDQRGGQGQGQQQQGGDDDRGGRNIFRIFSS